MSGPISSGSLSAVSATPVALRPRNPGQSAANARGETTTSESTTDETDRKETTNESQGSLVKDIERLVKQGQVEYGDTQVSRRRRCPQPLSRRRVGICSAFIRRGHDDAVATAKAM